MAQLRRCCTGTVGNCAPLVALTCLLTGLLLSADADVEEVSRQVCSKSTFRYVLPIHLRGIDRLAASELETFQFTNLPQNTEDSKSEISWPRRLRNHCKHMIKNLQGRELYEMWLKTSVGETHTNGKGFVNFFCFGEGIFSDCVERDRVINLDGKITWPAGDDLEEDEVDEVKIELKIHKIFFQIS